MSSENEKVKKKKKKGAPFSGKKIINKKTDKFDKLGAFNVQTGVAYMQEWTNLNRMEKKQQ